MLTASRRVAPLNQVETNRGSTVEITGPPTPSRRAANSMWGNEWAVARNSIEPARTSSPRAVNRRTPSRSPLVPTQNESST